jgi:phage-related protein
MSDDIPTRNPLLNNVQQRVNEISCHSTQNVASFQSIRDYSQTRGSALNTWVELWPVRHGSDPWTREAWLEA